MHKGRIAILNFVRIDIFYKCSRIIIFTTVSLFVFILRQPFRFERSIQNDWKWMKVRIEILNPTRTNIFYKYSLRKWFVWFVERKWPIWQIGITILNYSHENRGIYLSRILFTFSHERSLCERGLNLGTRFGGHRNESSFVHGVTKECYILLGTGNKDHKYRGGRSGPCWISIAADRTQWPSEYLSTHNRIRIRMRNSPVSLITIAHERRVDLQNLVESWGKTGRGWKICSTRFSIPVAVSIFISSSFLSPHFNFSIYIYIQYN